MAALAAPRARAPPAHRPPRRRRARSCASAPAGGGAAAAAAAKRALRAALEGVESFGLFGCGSPQAREDIEAAAAALEALCTHEEPASPAVVEVRAGGGEGRAFGHERRILALQHLSVATGAARGAWLRARV